MKAVLQRVTAAKVEIDGAIHGQIGPGLQVLLGVTETDTEEEARRLARKVVDLRIFTDEQDKMNLSLLDIGGGMLVVSNFTLCANARKGNRPNFSAAARPEQAVPLYELFVQCVQEYGVQQVQTGEFGADMHLTIENDGPVTIWLDTEEILSKHPGQTKSKGE